jgi:glycosyltransferase involved in cell wall biosynthesis
MKRYGRWKVVSIELSEPLRELSAEAGYEGIRAVFLWHGVALGHRQFSMEQLPLAPHHLANSAALAIAPAAGDYLLEEGFRSALPGLKEPELRDAVSALQKLLSLGQPMDLLRKTLLNWSGSRPASTISVAVCTRERPTELARCLRSLLASSEQPLEILVVDNAPVSDATREIVASFPGVRYYCEPRKGLSAARNAALSIASGDIVAFADDDVVVHEDWIGRIHRCFGDPKVMVATGLILPGELETPAQMIFEQDFQFFHQGYRARYFDTHYFAALQKKGVQVWSIGAGANMAIRREITVGGYRFDTRLGPGVFGGCGEDSEFWYRVLADGWSCVYEPSAFVYHFHRRELSGLRHQVRQYMQGHVAALLMQFAKYKHVGNLRRLLLVLPAEYFILMLRLVATGFALDNRILLSGALGCLSGLRFAFSRKQEQLSAK